MWRTEDNWGPQSSFTSPVADPGTDPVVPPFVWAAIPPTWMAVVVGALKQLVQRTTWLGTDAQVFDQQVRAMDLLHQIAIAGSTVPTSFEHDDTLVAVEPGLDVEDTLSIIATMADDPANNRVKLWLDAVPQPGIVSPPAGGTLLLSAAGSSVTVAMGAAPVDLGSDWYQRLYDDSGWHASVDNTDTYDVPIAGAVWETDPAYVGNESLHGATFRLRKHFTLEAGLLSVGTLTIEGANYIDGLFLNGVSISPALAWPGGSSVEGAEPKIIAIPSSYFVAGDNVLAVQVHRPTTDPAFTGVISSLSYTNTASPVGATGAAGAPGAPGPRGAPGSPGTSNLIIKVGPLTEAMATIEITSIPDTYSHLELVADMRSDAADTDNVYLYMQINDDTASNYSSVGNLSSGAAVAADQTTASTAARIGFIGGAASSLFLSSVLRLFFPNYAGGTFLKSWLGQNTWGRSLEASSLQAQAYDGVWYSSGPIESIHLIPAAGNFVVGTTVWLYGIP